jgi:hypothetical protein
MKDEGRRMKAEGRSTGVAAPGFILHPSSFILPSRFHPSSFILLPSSFILLPSSFIPGAAPRAVGHGAFRDLYPESTGMRAQRMPITAKGEILLVNAGAGPQRRRPAGSARVGHRH